MRVRRGIVVAVSLLALTSCGSGGAAKLTGSPGSITMPSASDGSSTTAPPVVTTGPTAAPSTTAAVHGPTTTKPAAAVVTASDADNGRTIAVHRGDTVRVVLGSIYWNFEPASDASVLAVQGTPVVAPQPAGCVRGQGCGTVTAVFGATGTGHAEVVATRTTCGEAMLCSPSNSRYTLAVTVV